MLTIKGAPEETHRISRFPELRLHSIYFNFSYKLHKILILETKTKTNEELKKIELFGRLAAKKNVHSFPSLNILLYFINVLLRSR